MFLQTFTLNKYLGLECIVISAQAVNFYFMWTKFFFKFEYMKLFFKYEHMHLGLECSTYFSIWELTIFVLIIYNNEEDNVNWEIIWNGNVIFCMWTISFQTNSSVFFYENKFFSSISSEKGLALERNESAKRWRAQQREWWSGAVSRTGKQRAREWESGGFPIGLDGGERERGFLI
jgi:hypothetical protein